MGYDSDHPLAAGEVGRVGVAIDSIDDMAALFDGIPLDRVSTSMTINATAIILLALYVGGRAPAQGVALDRLSGTIQNDILKEYIARGTYIYPPRPSLRIVTDIFAWCERELPRLEHDLDQRLSHPRGGIDGRAGSGVHARQRDRVRRGGARPRACDVNRVRPAALVLLRRAQRFARGDREVPRGAAAVGARSCATASARPNPRAQQLRFHTQTAGSTLTAQQPDNNIVRVALQALAAVLGGTQSLHCNGRDEALALPTEESARIALRTQQIIAAETGVANTVDPVGGAWDIERRTDAIEREARAAISTRSTPLAARSPAIEARRHPAPDPGRRRTRAQQAIDRGDAVVVGVNRLRGRADRAAIELLRIDPESERRQVGGACGPSAPAATAAAWRAAARRVVEQAARGGANLVPPVIAAVEARATLGEIADALRRVFGEHREIGA